MRLVLQNTVLCAAVLLHWPAAAQHATYRFATAAEHGFDGLTSYLRWELTRGGDVYLATKFYTGCGTGKFGGQIHSDGSHTLVFSMSDFDHVLNTAVGAQPWCTRSPADAGADCVLPYRFEADLEYRFDLTQSADETGAMWTLTVANSSSAAAALVGSIFMDQQKSRRDCSLLEAKAESLQERLSGGDFCSGASWRGPFLNRGDSGVAPVDVDVDCGPDAPDGLVPAMASAAVPRGPEGRPNVFFQSGRDVVHECERPSLWKTGVGLAPEQRSSTAGGASAPAWFGAGGAVFSFVFVGLIIASVFRRSDTPKRAHVEQLCALKDATDAELGPREMHGERFFVLKDIDDEFEAEDPAVNIRVKGTTKKVSWALTGNTDEALGAKDLAAVGDSQHCEALPGNNLSSIRSDFSFAPDNAR